ncbi:hypothetical protein OSB04_028311 [Centaurea solstitialis]|uniref:UDP-glycosyltransferase n=1 Tax=Centaurea solstitialis TaxID=347529 RepID=A0AA38W7L3_9ASTR|nr:hypothetical protein OSB04_028311 [Centaurea solstitialis]
MKEKHNPKTLQLVRSNRSYPKLRVQLINPYQVIKKGGLSDAIFTYLNLKQYNRSQLTLMDNQTEITGRRRRRILLFPLPFQGHINPMIQLANILYSKGFTITILHTDFNAPVTSNYPNFTFKSVLDNHPQDPRISELPTQGISAAMSRLTHFNEFGADSFRRDLEELLSEKDEATSCLITDALWYFTQGVADGLKLPRLVLRTSSLFSTVFYSSIPLLDDRGYFKLDETRK